MKRLISALLIVAMMLNMVACGPSNPDPGSSSRPSVTSPTPIVDTPATPKASPPEINGALDTPADYVGTPGTDFPILSLGDGAWEDMPAPPLDIAGGKAMYSRVTYAPWSSLDNTWSTDKRPRLELKYNSGYSYVDRWVVGALWTYTLSLTGDYEQYTPNWLVYRARAAGFDVLGTPGDLTAFVRRDPELTIWVQTELLGTSLNVTVCASPTLSPSSELKAEDTYVPLTGKTATSTAYSTPAKVTAFPMPQQDGYAVSGTTLSLDFSAMVASPENPYHYWKSDDRNRNEYCAVFTTRPTPGKLQAMYITIEGPTDCGITIRANEDIEMTNLNTQYGLYSNDTLGGGEENIISPERVDNFFVLDNITLSEQEIQWVVAWSDDDPENISSLARNRLRPDKVTITLVDVADVEPITWGEALGQLRVSGVAIGSASVLPQEGVSYTHADLPQYVMSDNTVNHSSGGTSVQGVRDQHGDLYFTLPAGYYTLRATSEYSEATVQTFERLIPVSSGEITTFTLPEEYSATLRLLDQEYSGGFEAAEGRVTVTDAVDHGDTATLTLTINDPVSGREIEPSMKDFTVKENGLEGEIASLARSPAANDVVLVLDSSGSMGENMRPAVDAAKRFVETLPDETHIQLLQFQQILTPHQGTTKTEILANLDTVVEGGGTALYDATSAALQMLASAERPYAVVFSDGADSRELVDAGKGSDLNKQQILEQIAQSNACVLTIGFGEGHDPGVLIEMSAASNAGQYYSAADETQLEAAFGAVARKFGNQYTLSYKRPTQSRDYDSDVPVISFMIDCSGSMDLPPGSRGNEDVDFRIYRVKMMLRQYIEDLPDGVLMQMGNFRGGGLVAETIGMRQMTTTDKAKIFASIQTMFAGDGTPTLDALINSNKALGPIPSSKKVLVFFTDAALDVGDTMRQAFETELASLKKAGIRTLFLGYGNAEYAEKYAGVFERAAELAGGDYLITSDLSKIAAKLQELLGKLDVSERPQNIMLELSLDTAVTAGGSAGDKLTASGSLVVEHFALKEKPGNPIAPSFAKLTTGEPFIQYDRDGAQKLYGGDVSVQETRAGNADDTRIISRFTLEGGIHAQNDMALLTATEYYTMDKFKGLSVPYGTWIALELQMSMPANSSMEGYSVPSVFQHFYLSVNGQAVPASEATWLAETPFAVPGSSEAKVMKGKTVSGMMLFAVPVRITDEVKQMALHFYDSKYGHMVLPITGQPPALLTNIDSLPTAAPFVTDAFSLSVTGTADVPELLGVKTRNPYADRPEATVFRLAEATFESKVQALLNLVPQDRMLLSVETEQGPLLTKMNNILYTIPLGFSGETMLAPGAVSPVRMPFEIAKGLTSAPSNIIGDIQNGSLKVPVTTGTPYPSSNLGTTYAHEYFDLVINAIHPVSAGGRYVVLDFTLTDKKDGTGFGSPETIFLLERDTNGMEATGEDNITVDSVGRITVQTVKRKGLGNFGSDEFRPQLPVGVIGVDASTSRYYLYGAVETIGDWGVMDGHSRRGVLLFTLPDYIASDWTLTSPFIPELHVPVSADPYPYTPLLAERTNVDRNDSFQKQLDAKTSAAISLYRAEHAISVSTVGLDGNEAGVQMSPPSVTSYGAAMIDSVKTDTDFLNLMYTMRWVPYGSLSALYYAPEAVVTQGWGHAGELAWLAKDMLTRLGYKPELRHVSVTQAGMDNLNAMAGMEVSYHHATLYGLYYTDAKGQERCFVVPFMRDISELAGLVGVAKWNSNQAPTVATARVQISVRAELTDSDALAQIAAMSDISSALGGSGEAGPIYEDIVLLDEEISSFDASLDAMDIRYMKAGVSAKEGGDIIMAGLSTPSGFFYNQNYYIDTGFYRIEEITITTSLNWGGPTDEHVMQVREGEKLTGITHSLAFGIAGMTSEAAKYNEKVSAAAVKDTDTNKLADITRVNWLAHQALQRLSRGLSVYNEENAELLEVITGRYNSPLTAMVTTRALHVAPEDGSADPLISIDLMRHQETMIGGSEENQYAYNLMLGFYASDLEAVTLPGGQSYVDVWASLSERVPTLVVGTTNEDRLSAAIMLEATGYPTLLVERLADVKNLANTAFFIPIGAGELHGGYHFAWLEVNATTFDVISMFDTGERAGMASYVMSMKPKNIMEYATGALVGVTCSIVAVSAYALEFDDYKQIMDSAFALSALAYHLLKGVVDKLGDYSEWIEDPVGKAMDQLKDAAKDAAKEAKQKAMDMAKAMTGIDVQDLADKIGLTSNDMAKIASGEMSLSDVKDKVRDSVGAALKDKYGSELAGKLADVIAGRVASTIGGQAGNIAADAVAAAVEAAVSGAIDQAVSDIQDMMLGEPPDPDAEPEKPELGDGVDQGDLGAPIRDFEKARGENFVQGFKHAVEIYFDKKIGD